MNPREKSVVNAIHRYLKTVPGLWYMNVHGSNTQRAGVPDVIGCYRGRFFWFEIKRPGGEASKIQLRRIEMMKEAGAVIGAVVSSRKEVEDVLSRLGSE